MKNQDYIINLKYLNTQNNDFKTVVLKLNDFVSTDKSKELSITEETVNLWKLFHKWSFIKWIKIKIKDSLLSSDICSIIWVKFSEDTHFYEKEFF